MIMPASPTFDIESLVHLEQSFYDSGYEDGHAHGRVHGLIEGRALGREKGFEMWEEISFYEGFAIFWRSVCIAQGREDDCGSRVFNHIKHLLSLIAQFPCVNPSTVEGESSIDIPKLFRQIRSRYKALCATLGVRPSLRASGEQSSVSEGPTGNDETIAIDQGGGDKKSVWAIEKPPASSSMSF
ncbi:hypothetical protein PM082_013085 [Marasmius tenuissimus]|nr:hypothetical protein PM082_013085 [Marasmius tenuissimus]